MTRDSSAPPSRRRWLSGLTALPLVPLAAACETIVPGKGPPPIFYR